MANRIWRRWDTFCSRLPLDPPATFDFWLASLQVRARRPYITVTFLLHLLRPSEFPIIDQHTFRAMNALVGGVRPDWTGKKTPSTLDDLLAYTEFFTRLLAAWPGHKALSRGDLDKGLMVYGQRLKQTSRTRSAPAPAGTPKANDR